MGTEVVKMGFSQPGDTGQHDANPAASMAKEISAIAEMARTGERW